MEKECANACIQKHMVIFKDVARIWTPTQPLTINDYKRDKVYIYTFLFNLINNCNLNFHKNTENYYSLFRSLIIFTTVDSGVYW